MSNSTTITPVVEASANTCDICNNNKSYKTAATLRIHKAKQHIQLLIPKEKDNTENTEDEEIGQEDINGDTIEDSENESILEIKKYS